MKKQWISMIVLVAFAGVALAEKGNKTRTPSDSVASNFYRFDVDVDGKLSEAEYLEKTRVRFEKKGKAGYEKSAAKRFAYTDLDGDHFIFRTDCPGPNGQYPQCHGLLF